MDPQLITYEKGMAEYLVGIRTSEKLNHKKVSFTLKNPGIQKENGFQVLCAHSFVLEIPLDYADNIEAITVGKAVSVYGGMATIDKVSISPLSVTVFLSDLSGTKTYGSEMKNAEKANDRLVVELKDGTKIDSDKKTMDYDLFDDTDVISMGFHKIISKEDIAKITFGGVECYKE